jgi:hypothetical protein
VRGTAQAELVGSIRKAAAACNVTPNVVRRGIARGWLPQPPWTLRQIHEVRDLNDPGRRLRGPGAAHGSETRWTQGCSWDLCRKAKTDAVEAGDRRGVDKRLPVELPQQLLDAIYAGKPFRARVIHLGLTSNQVWGLTETDEHWTAALEAALMTSRDDLKHWHEPPICLGLGLQRVSGRPMHPDGQTREGRAGAVVAATEGEIVESGPS